MQEEPLDPSAESHPAPATRPSPAADHAAAAAMIVACAEAAEANLRDPNRRGNVVVLTDDTAKDVFISADLHGHRPNFEAILAKADLPGHPRRHLVLQEVCHGGPAYPDGRGCMSHLMLEEVIHLKRAFPDRVHFILSNHELAELTDYPIVKSKRMLNLVFRLGIEHKYGAEAENVRRAYQAFIRSCPLAVRLPGGVFISHSAPERIDRFPFDATIFDRPVTPAELLQDGDVFELVWGRDYRPENARAFAQAVGAKVLIHGHDPCPEGFRAPNDLQIILDCCSDAACCLLIPTHRDWTHAELVSRIQRLT